MGGGLDRVYPAENSELAIAIVDQGGALVSEQPFGARPRTGNLIARNRLQTGLSAALIVAQTGVRGGSMHTERMRRVTRVRRWEITTEPICPATEPHQRTPVRAGIASRGDYLAPRAEAFLAVEQLK
jgi:DNA processing protein